MFLTSGFTTQRKFSSSCADSSNQGHASNKSGAYSPQIFVHIGLQHFLVNMLSLYFLGRQMEQIFGSKQSFLYLPLSGMMGNLFVLVFSPTLLLRCFNCPSTVCSLYCRSPLCLTQPYFNSYQSYLSLLGQPSR